MKPRLALFDLDHTLLSGDSDVLWCDFLMDQGVLERASFAARNADMETRYKAGTVGVQEFADFYVGTLAGRTRSEWETLRREFLATQVVPRIPVAALQLVRAHLHADDVVVMTTATNRFITELTAAHFGITHLLATEAELDGDTFTGRSTGTLNMREGKVARLHEWLQARGHSLGEFDSTAYSDSINDLPLLEAVNEPVAVDPDPRLAKIANERRWRVLQLH
ncbi:MAG: HAD family hydrolase [Ramlibacter sp.]|nr:HAD-IB family hydrolase [Ramlibacter sp.]